MKGLFDHYTFRARLTPAFLCGLPAALAVMAWFSAEFWSWGAFWAFVVASGFTALLSEIGRDKGKTKEKDLWKSWGGAPTTRHLRHSGPLDSSTRARYHRRLEELIPNLTLPTPDQEHSDRKEADRTYQTCTNWLKEHTRDQKKYPLVYKELVSYGFRRNLWGLKPIGLTVTAVALLTIAVRIAQPLYQSQNIPALALPSGGITILLLVLWIFWIRPDWIRIPADGYAQRLLASLETLSEEKKE